MAQPDFQLFCSLEFKMRGSHTRVQDWPGWSPFYVYSLLFVAESARGLTNGRSGQQQLECGDIMQPEGSFFCVATKLHERLVLYVSETPYQGCSRE